MNSKIQKVGLRWKIAFQLGCNINIMIEEKDIPHLRPHEMTIPSRIEEIKAQILSTKSIDYPIIVDRESWVILDGHHRYTCAKELWITKIPCFLVDYFSSEIEVWTWRENETPPQKEEVIHRALTWNIFSPKSTRHTYNFLIPQVQYFLDI